MRGKDYNPNIHAVSCILYWMDESKGNCGKSPTLSILILIKYPSTVLIKSLLTFVNTLAISLNIEEFFAR